LGQFPGGPSTKLTVLRSGVFSSVLRETKFANLEPLVNGPTCVLSTNVADVEYPQLMKQSVELLSKNKKLLLLGGKLDNVGVIEAPVRKLLGTLEQPAAELHSVLDRRID
jgi:large subunit ribosomal protein L10